MTDEAVAMPTAVAEPAARDKKIPGIWVSIGWIILYFVVLQGLGVILATGLLAGWDKVGNQSVLRNDPAILLWGIAVASASQLAIMASYLGRRDRMAQIGLTHFGHMKWTRALGLALVLVITAMLFNALYANFVISGIEMQADYAEILARLEMTPLNVATGIFVVVVAAPIVEELLFRGFLQQAIAKYLPVWAAILLSSFAFSAMHGQYYAIPALMSLSIAFGYLYHRTGSLRMNILLHMANNAAALALSQMVR